MYISLNVPMLIEIGHIRFLFGSLLSIMSTPDSGGDVFQRLTYIATIFEDFLIGLGGVIFTCCMVIAGFMRSTAFGSERKIAASNTAVVCAIVGLLMILLATPISDYLKSVFPLPTDAVQGQQDGNAYGNIRYIASVLAGFLVGLSIIVFNMGIVVAGLMRALSFGSERRIAASNAAVVCAIVGLFVILLAGPVNQYIQSIFPLPANP